nr:hypothetical protein [Tanacetum cinerariifolium]
MLDYYMSCLPQLTLIQRLSHELSELRAPECLPHYLMTLIVVVRQAHLVDTNTESRPIEDLWETEVPQLLLVVPSPVPSSDTLYLTVRHARTPTTIDSEFEPKEAPSETEEFEASEPLDIRITSSYSLATSDPTASLSPDHPRMLARIAKADALSSSLFCKRYRSSYETPSPSSSLTLPIRKRYQEDEGHGSKDEGPGSEEEEEEAAPEVSPSSPAVPTLVALPVTTPAATIVVDVDEFLWVGCWDIRSSSSYYCWSSS